MVVRVLEEVHDEAHHLSWSLLVNCTQSTDTQGEGLQCVCVCVCGGGCQCGDSCIWRVYTVFLKLTYNYCNINYRHAVQK